MCKVVLQMAYCYDLSSSARFCDQILGTLSNEDGDADNDGKEQ